MTVVDAAKSLSFTKQHLNRVLAAWDDPVDWADLTIYGFYCLEAAVVASALHAGLDFRRSHSQKAEAAKELYLSHDLPDVSGFLWQLNAARKAVAYGDVDLPDLDAEDVARRIEDYVDSVSAFLEE
ncbi:MAG: hypothetical protein OXR72_20640 [Gemmatimonadota bacterium]|nr:hypothetical protein [Gemmatimonadota bacterium]